MGDGVRRAVSVGDRERHGVRSRLLRRRGWAVRPNPVVAVTEVPLRTTRSALPDRTNRCRRSCSVRPEQDDVKAAVGGGVASTRRGVGEVQHRGDAAVVRGRTPLTRYP